MILVSASLFHVYILTVFRHLISRVSINVKALIGAFNYEKTLIGAFSMFGKSSRTFVWSVCTTLIQLWGLPTTARVGISLKIFSKNAKNWTYILPHSLTNELLPFMSPWNIVYISKLRRYCIRPGASGRISTSQWAFHNLARPSVVCVDTGHRGHVHIYIDQGYAVTPLPQLQIQLYLYPWDGWDWCLVPSFQDSKTDIQTHNQHDRNRTFSLMLSAQVI